MQIIEIQNVSKIFNKKKKALDNISLSIKKNELFGLLGINGAGKKTLINILTGLIKKTSGKIYVNGLDIDKRMWKIKRMINCSPQETALAPNLTVKQNIEFFASVYDIKDLTEADHIVDKFKLRPIYDQKAKTLSGGWQRKLSIAIALITGAQILFLDEPTLGLDVFSRRELWDIILELKQDRTIILTSHYLQEIEALCDRVAVLSNGHVLTVGTVEELKKTNHTKDFEEAFMETVKKGENEKSV